MAARSPLELSLSATKHDECCCIVVVEKHKPRAAQRRQRGEQEGSSWCSGLIANGRPNSFVSVGPKVKESVKKVSKRIRFRDGDRAVEHWNSVFFHFAFSRPFLLLLFPVTVAIAVAIVIVVAALLFQFGVFLFQEFDLLFEKPNVLGLAVKLLLAFIIDFQVGVVESFLGLRQLFL